MSLLDKAENYLIQHNISYTSLFVVKILKEKIKTIEAIFTISGIDIIILVSAGTSFKKAATSSFYNLTSILKSTENIVLFRFNNKKELRFQIDDVQNFLDSVLDHIHRIFAPFEFSQLTIPKTSVPLSPPTSNSILFRLRTMLNIHKVKIPDKYLKLYMNQIFTHSQHTTLFSFKKMEKFFPIYFPCLSMCKDMHEIRIAKINPSALFPIMLDNISCFKNINHIQVDGFFSHLLSRFIVKSSHINGVSIHNVELSHENIESLIKLIQRKKFTSVGFINSLNNENLHILINAACFNKIRYLRIENFQFNFSRFFPKFNRIYALSLRGCNLMIGNVLSILTISDNSLFEIDLSGNVGNGFIDKDLKISPQLEKIYINDVKWTSKQLLMFFEYCSSDNSNLSTLIMNRNQCDKWDDFYNGLIIFNSKKQHNFMPMRKNTINKRNLVQKFYLNSLKNLGWNENPLNQKIISFFSNQPNLSEISLCNSTGMDMIIHLLKALPIKKANIKAIQEEKFICFVQAIPQMKYLEKLDISNNNIDEECFDQLANSLLSSSIEFIAFDGSKLKSKDSYIHFIDIMKARKMPLKISYPLEDFERFQLSQTEINDMIKLFDNLQISLLGHSSSPQAYLNDINFLNLDYPFPKFISDEEIKMCEKKLKEKIMVENHFSEEKYQKEVNAHVEKPVIMNNDKGKFKSPNKSLFSSLDTASPAINDFSSNEYNESSSILNENNQTLSVNGTNQKIERVSSSSKKLSSNKADNVKIQQTKDQTILSSKNSMTQNLQNSKNDNERIQSFLINDDSANENQSSISYYSENSSSNDKSKNVLQKNLNNPSSHHFTDDAHSSVNLQQPAPNKKTNSMQDSFTVNSQIHEASHQSLKSHKKLSDPMRRRPTYESAIIYTGNPMSTMERRSQSAINKPISFEEQLKMDGINIIKKRHWEKKKKKEWMHFDIPSPPSIDNSLILLNYNSEFSIHKLLKKMIT